jgi:hypothetical protein
MSIINVLTSGELQPALNRALPGDEVILSAGVRYAGAFVLPPKSGLVTIRPPKVFWGRIGPSEASLMPTIASGSSGRAIDGTGAKNWTLHGVRCEPNVGGFGEVLGFENAENIHLDAILLVVPEGQQQKRGILGNGRHITLARSHLSGIWRQGQDSQAFAAWDGAGPYTLTDNYLEAASENILFGGSDASSEANIPADILIDGNTITKPLAWKGLQRQVKNLLELKAARRVRIVNNDLSNNWADAQSGFSVLFTPRNQDGSAPYTSVEDVTFEKNRLRNVARGFNISGYDDLNPSRQTTRIVIRDNDIETTGTGCLVHHGCGTVAVYRNSFGATQGRALLSLDRNEQPYAVYALTWAENTGGGYLHSPDAIGEAALKAYAKTYSLTVPTSEPAVPAPVDGPPVPLPGTTIEAPSVPTADPVQALKSEIDILRLAFGILRLRLDQVESDHAKLLAYLKAVPKVTRIEQLRAYIKAAPGV